MNQNTAEAMRGLQNSNLTMPIKNVYKYFKMPGCGGAHLLYSCLNWPMVKGKAKVYYKCNSFNAELTAMAIIQYKKTGV